MAIVSEGCWGLDVQAQTVVACLRTPAQKARRPCSTMTDDLLRVADW